jgi:ABC-type lipoprotein release transport system permease subunit
VSTTDLPTYVATLIVIFAACLLAAWIPVRPAARVGPMTLLRHF